MTFFDYVQELAYFLLLIMLMIPVTVLVMMMQEWCEGKNKK